MKRGIALLLSVVLLFSLCACGTDKAQKPDEDKIQIVTTLFPEYDWLRNLLGDTDSVELTLLIDNGVDLHSYQPSVADMVKISTCDVFVYTGGVSDDWVADALKNAQNKDMVVVNLMDIVAEHREVCLHEHEHEEGETDHVHVADEHIWLSLANAEFICEALTETLKEVDPDNSETYAANLDAYLEQISALNEQYEDVVDKAKYDTVVFGDRFPFAYLADDYDLKYAAAFVGCSAETEVGFGTIAKLAATLDQLGADMVLTIDGSDEKIADTIIASTADKNQEIGTMQSMQAVTADQIAQGATWLGYMEENLAVLQQALN